MTASTSLPLPSSGPVPAARALASSHAAGPPDAAADVLPTASPLTPVPWALGRSVAGVVGLGLVAGIAGQEEALASAPAGLLSGAGVMLLTTPALVVGHQYLRMQARPSQLVLALWDGFTRAGIVALGLVPAIFWIGATSNMGPWLGVLALLAIGALGTLFAVRNLARVEDAAGGSFSGGSGLALVWAGLAGLVGLRLVALFSF